MNPEIFSIGSLSIRWYSVLILTGIIIAILLAEKESKKFKYEKQKQSTNYKHTYIPYIKTHAFIHNICM